MSDPLPELLETWEEEAAVLDRVGYETHAADLRRRVADLRDALQRSEAVWLSTAEAAAYSGYSEDHLRELAQEETVIAEKEGGAWTFVRRALPRKARSADPDLRPAERAARRAHSS